MSNYRTEHDSLGTMQVPSDALWAAQTQRSLKNFQIGHEKVSLDVIYATAIIKSACATANEKCGKMDHQRAELIRKVCKEIVDGKLDKHFPTCAYQAGSGTQTNMNVNEVIATRANQLAKKKLIHPNDHCNMSQSTNDVYPTAMNLTALHLIETKLFPAIDGLVASMKKLETKYKDVIKMGRTHIQDALPITFGQEVSGWRFALENAKKMIKASIPFFCELNMGGTAVGTGMSAPLKKGYDKYCVAAINQLMNTKRFKVTPNKFHGTWSKDNFVFAHGAIKALAMNLYKIAQDVRFLASGPRCGFGEINIPQNEPGSSIMPGKVNPTQCEGMMMIACQVAGHDTAIAMLASQGNFELNTYGTVLMQNFIQSVTLFSDMINSFNKNCVSGITINKKKMDYNVNNSLMLVTALKETIGYEKAAAISEYAYEHNLSLKEAAMKLKYVTSAEYDKIVDPKKMV